MRREILGAGLAIGLAACATGERASLLEEGDFTLAPLVQETGSVAVYSGEHGILSVGNAIMNLDVDYAETSGLAAISNTNHDTRDDDAGQVFSLPADCAVRPLFDKDGSVETQDDRFAADYFGGFIINTSRSVNDLHGPGSVILNYAADPADKPQYVQQPEMDALVQQIESNEDVRSVLFDVDGSQFTLFMGLDGQDFNDENRAKKETVDKLHAATVEVLDDVYAYCGLAPEIAATDSGSANYELYPDTRMIGSLIVNNQPLVLETSYAGADWAKLSIHSGERDEASYVPLGVPVACEVTQDFVAFDEPYTTGNFTLHPQSNDMEAQVYDQTQAASIVTSKSPEAGNPVIDKILESDTIDYFTFTEDNRVSAHVRSDSSFTREGEVTDEAVEGAHRDFKAVLETIDLYCADIQNADTP